jgi:hypothetical protein
LRLCFVNIEGHGGGARLRWDERGNPAQGLAIEPGSSGWFSTVADLM